MKTYFKHSVTTHGLEFVKCFIGLPDENTKKEWDKIKRIIDLQLEDKV